MISIMGLIMGVGTPVIIAGFQSFALGSAIQEADASARLAMERMMRELRDAQRSTLAPSSGTSSSLNFTPIQGGAITYTFSGTQLKRNAVLLAEDVTGSFTVSPVVSTEYESYSMVTVDMTITKRANLGMAESGQSIRVKSGVFPRYP
ncbi:MAG: hypothetical protein H7837_10650 [Magnetococcus sp. MYC-9]